MSEDRAVRALLVDPSLFTGPYDAALTQGLVDAGVQPLWATRPTRSGDLQEIPTKYVDDFFYRRVDEAEFLPSKLRGIAKGLSHLVGLFGLIARVWRNKPDVVHFQWAVLPIVDAIAMRIIGWWSPVVMTVHDSTPFNGERISLLQNIGFDLPLRTANHVIVHTQAGYQALVNRGINPKKISVIAHGPLSLLVPMPPRTAHNALWTFVLFGEIKPYKGLDILIQAVKKLPLHIREKLRIVVAGRPRMDMTPLTEQISILKLEKQFEMRLHRLTDEEMAALFSEADCFLFPYRQIDASGVYFLTKSLGRWLIASRVGIFAEDIKEGIEGALVPSEDAQALAAEMQRAVESQLRPDLPSSASSWQHIGRQTSALYLSLCSKE